MAGKAIRGITVEIGGNTTKLDKALASTEKKSRSLQVELRDIEKLLKFDPTNTELLAQKQDVLKSAISETADKLNTLKEAEAQVIAQFERGEIAENQLRAFQREITQTERDLADMRNELSATEKAIKDVAKGGKDAEEATSDYGETVKKAKEELDDFKDKAAETFETLKDGAVTIGTAIGGAVVAVGSYALKLSTDFDKAFNTLITKTGASAEEMDELNEAMERVYANNFGESIEDVANSMATVKTMTGLAGDELQKTTENALLMRDTFDMEVNESIRAVNALMDQFGLTADEAYNLIAQGAQKGLNQNDDLLDTINEYSLQFKTAGYSAEDMFNMLANGVEAGTWSVDKLGDAVKEFNIRASDGTISEAIKENAKAFGLTWREAKTLASEVANGNVDAYQQLADKLREIDDDTKRYQLGVSMFGTMWEDLGEETVLALLNTQGEISKTSSALDDINNQKYDDIGSALQGLGRTLEIDVVKPLGEELTPLVEEAIEYVQANGPQIKEVISGIVDAVGKFVGFIVDNADAILATIAGIGTGLLVWNVVSMITGVVNAIKAFKLANEGATVAQWLLNAAMNANPLGIIITVIVAIVAAIAAFIATNDEARAKFIEIWNKIKEVCGEVWDAIVQFFKDAWEWIKNAWASAKEWFASLWEGIKSVFASVVEFFGNLFSAAWDSIKAVWDFVVAYYQAIWEGIKAVFSIAKELIVLYFKNAWEGVKLVWSVVVSYFATVWENIKLVFSVAKTFFVGMFKTAWEGVKAVWNAVSGYFKAVWDTIKGIFSVVKNVLTGNWKDAWNGIKGIVNTWKSYFSSIWDSIKNVFGSVKSWFTSTFSGAWSAVKGVFSNWGSFFSGLWSSIQNTFSKIGTNIANAISGSVRSGVNGVISSIESVINKGIGLINGAINMINKLPGVSVGKLSTLSLPRLAKGGIVDSPTLAEIGEDGREAIIPLEKNTGWLREVARELNEHLAPQSSASAEMVSRLDKIYERLERLQVVLDSGELVGGIIDPVDAALSDKYSKTARGW